jgi:hypothetical protein
MDAFTQSIVVGVTGRGENTDALAFAVREAAALGRGVTLVHAVPQPPLAPPPSPLITDDALDVVGRAILQEVSEELRGTSGDEVPVATLPCTANPAPCCRTPPRRARSSSSSTATSPGCSGSSPAPPSPPSRPTPAVPWWRSRPGLVPRRAVTP